MNTRDQLVEFIRTIARPDSDLEAIGDEENLVEAGVVDSLAVVQRIVYLETEHRLNIAALDPAERVSIQGILSVIET